MKFPKAKVTLCGKIFQLKYLKWCGVSRGVARKFLMVGHDLELMYTHKKHAHVYVRHHLKGVCTHPIASCTVNKCCLHEWHTTEY